MKGRRTLTVCTTPGCAELTTRGRCDEHHREARRATDARRPSGAARGSTRRWATFRKTYLTQHPTCTTDGCNRSAVDVHHLDGCGRTGPRAYEEDNLAALCHEHHSSLTASQPRGTPAAPPAPPAPSQPAKTGSPTLR